MITRKITSIRHCVECFAWKPVAYFSEILVIMGNRKETLICRLCFMEIKENSFKIIEEIHKEMLEVIVKKLNWELSVEPVICDECLTKLNKSFSFKSNCIYIEDVLTPYSIKQDHTYLKGVKEKDDNCGKEIIIDIPEQQLCRLCITLIDGCAVNLRETDKDTFKKYLPEINSCVNSIDVICSACFKLMQDFFNFSQMCTENDSKLETYCKTIRRKHNRQVALVAFLEYTVGKKKTSEGSVCDGRLATRKLPDGRFGCPICPYVTKQLPYMRVHKLSHENISDVKLYKCPECSLETKYQCVLKKHIKTKHSEDAKMFKCNTCSFKTMHKISLRRHVVIHQETTMYKCEKCSFQTKYQSTMGSHVCKEKKPKISYTCELCPYKTFRKNGLKHHSFVHQRPSDSELLKCKVCEFKTPRRNTLLRHEKIHDRGDTKLTLQRCPHCVHETFGLVSLKIHLCKVHNYPKKMSIRDKYLKERDIRTYKCMMCDFAAKTGSALSNHAKRIHEASKLRINTERKMYKCDVCDYRNYSKYHLKLHKIKHKEVPDEEMHKCDKCSFKSKYAACLKNHRVKHNNSTFKCSICSFETKHRKSIIQHTHIRHGLHTKLYKCEKCSFTSKWHTSIQNHQTVHGEAALRCTKCEFKTRYPKSLRNHIRDLHNVSTETDKNPNITRKLLKCTHCHFKTDSRRGLSLHKYKKHKETVTTILYNCDKCTFSSIFKSTFMTHLLVHKDIPLNELFKCEYCEFKSKYKRSLRNHVSNKHESTCD